MNKIALDLFLLVEKESTWNLLWNWVVLTGSKKPAEFLQRIFGLKNQRAGLDRFFSSYQYPPAQKKNGRDFPLYRIPINQKKKRIQP